MHKTLLKSLVLMATLLVQTSAFAIPSITGQYEVYNAAGNCPGGDHGLWTNSLNAGSSRCNDYYSFQEGSLFTEYDNGTASLVATALNPDNILATILVQFSGFSNTHSLVKTGGGPELPSWSFYEDIDPTSFIEIQGIDYALSMVGNYALQVGDGANDKTSAFGGSVWVNAAGGQYQGGHWDLNMDFGAVPEPSVLLLLLAGLAGITLLSPRRAHPV